MSDLLKLNPDFKPAFDGKALAKELIAKILVEQKLTQAFLFGSAAENKNTENSDLDILLVIPNDADEKNYYKVTQRPFFSSRAVDWIVKKESDFNIQKNIGGISLIAYQTGILIYDDKK